MSHNELVKILLPNILGNLTGTSIFKLATLWWGMQWGSASSPLWLLLLSLLSLPPAGAPPPAESWNPQFCFCSTSTIVFSSVLHSRVGWNKRSVCSYCSIMNWCILVLRNLILSESGNVLVGECYWRVESAIANAINLKITIKIIRAFYLETSNISL